jgi:DNA topoisomerase-1
VTDVLVRSFPDIIDVKFTAGMEDRLDAIEEEKIGWKTILHEFYGPFEADLTKASADMRVGEFQTEMKCEKCGKPMARKWSRKGGWFLACTGYPECKNTKSIEVAADGRISIRERKRLDDKCPECGEPLIERHGRYGKFIACSGYPKCRYIKKDRKPERNISCPNEECDGRIVRKRGKGRRYFYACTKYPECTFTAVRLSDIEAARDDDSSA